MITLLWEFQGTRTQNTGADLGEGGAGGVHHPPTPILPEMKLSSSSISIRF